MTDKGSPLKLLNKNNHITKQWDKNRPSHWNFILTLIFNMCFFPNKSFRETTCRFVYQSGYLRTFPYESFFLEVCIFSYKKIWRFQIRRLIGLVLKFFHMLFLMSYLPSKIFNLWVCQKKWRKIALFSDYSKRPGGIFVFRATVIKTLFSYSTPHERFSKRKSCYHITSVKRFIK